MLFLITAFPVMSAAKEQIKCGDGPRYKIDIEAIKIEYSGISFEGALGFLSKLELGLKFEEETLQKASDTTQQWNQFLIGLAEGFNSCAITKKDYQEAISSLYPGLQVDAKKMLDLGKALEEGRSRDYKEIRRLLDTYVNKIGKFAEIAGKEEIIKKVEKEHEATREILSKKIDDLAARIDDTKEKEKIISDKERIIEELRQKLRETEQVLQRRGASEALAQFEKGNYEEAEKLFQKERQNKKAEAANAAYYLGNIKFAQLDFKTASQHYLDAVNDEPNNSVYLNAAGYLLFLLADYRASEPLYQRSLKITEKVLGPNHPDVATVLNDLALLYDKQGKYEAAEPLYQRSLTIAEKALGPNHPNVATVLKNLSDVYKKMGRDDEARNYSERSKQIEQKNIVK